MRYFRIGSIFRLVLSVLLYGLKLKYPPLIHFVLIFEIRMGDGFLNLLLSKFVFSLSILRNVNKKNHFQIRVLLDLALKFGHAIISVCKTFENEVKI